MFLDRFVSTRVAVADQENDRCSVGLIDSAKVSWGLPQAEVGAGLSDTQIVHTHGHRSQKKSISVFVEKDF